MRVGTGCSEVERAGEPVRHSRRVTLCRRRGSDYRRLGLFGLARSSKAPNAFEGTARRSQGGGGRRWLVWWLRWSIPQSSQTNCSTSRSARWRCPQLDGPAGEALRRAARSLHLVDLIPNRRFRRRRARTSRQPHHGASAGQTCALGCPQPNQLRTKGLKAMAGLPARPSRGRSLGVRQPGPSDPAGRSELDRLERKWAKTPLLDMRRPARRAHRGVTHHSVALHQGETLLEDRSRVSWSFFPMTRK